MRIGLVGFAGSGKTTVFNTMTGLGVPVGYGGELRIGTVRVPDPRIDALSKMFSPKKTTFAEMSFSDIPGEHGAEKRDCRSKPCSRFGIRTRCVWCYETSRIPRSRAMPIRCETSSVSSRVRLRRPDPIERRLHRALKEKMPPQEHAASS